VNDRVLPVTVVGGYLGAGKTTLVNHVLRHAPRPVAVVVNDFGDLDIDAALLVDNDGEVLTFANGCVCCDLSEGLVVALDRIRTASPLPDRVLIESSGVGELATIANYAALPGLRLDATVCVVDAASIDERVNDRWVGDLVRAQIRDADLVVCNKVDLVDRSGRAEAHDRIASIAPSAVVLDADHGRVDLEVLFDGVPTGRSESGSERDERRDGELGPDASTMFVTWVHTFDAPVAIDELRTALDALPAGIVRVKGVVPVLDDGEVRPMLVQVVGRRRELTAPPAGAAAIRTVSFIAVRQQLDPKTVPALLSSSGGS
jgi:G3E family GTPase